MTTNRTAQKLSELSVVISWFNGKKYLTAFMRNAIELANAGAEVIIVNDGTNDSSDLDLKEELKKISRIHIYDYENSGSAEARNRGMKLVKTEYFIFMDCDDEVYVDRLAESLMIFKQSNCDIAISNYETFPDDSIRHQEINPEPGRLRSDQIFQTMGFWRYIYTKKWIQKSNLFFYPNFSEAKGFFILDDAFFLLQLAASHPTLKVLSDQEPFYKYQLDPERNDSWNRYLNQVKRMPKVATNFLKSKKYLHIQSTLDYEWLIQSLAQFVIESTSRLKFVDGLVAVCDLNSFFSLIKIKRSQRTITILRIIYQNLKNSLYPKIMRKNG